MSCSSLVLHEDAQYPHEICSKRPVPMAYSGLTRCGSCALPSSGGKHFFFFSRKRRRHAWKVGKQAEYLPPTRSRASSERNIGPWLTWSNVGRRGFVVTWSDKDPLGCQDSTSSHRGCRRRRPVVLLCPVRSATHPPRRRGRDPAPCRTAVSRRITALWNDSEKTGRPRETAASPIRTGSSILSSHGVFPRKRIHPWARTTTMRWKHSSH
jgi:hypothetical protein